MSATPRLLTFKLPAEPSAGSPLLPGGDPNLPLSGLRSGAQGDAPERAALVNSADEAQAWGRLAIIQPILDYDRHPKPFGISRGELIASLCQIHSVSRRTLFNWQRAYRQGGLAALADRARDDKGRSRWFAANPRAAALAAYLYLDCRQSYQAVHAALIAEQELLQIDPRDLPAYSTVRSFLASLPPYLQVLARQGRRAYRERMSPYLAAAYTDLRPNEVWVADHMIHDVEVANDCFDELEWGAPMRLRFTSIMDRRSRYFAGASWCPEGSSRSIATALRRAILQYGPCRLFYCDNGKDFRKVARGAQPGSLLSHADIRGWQEGLDSVERTGLLSRLGVSVTRCLPYHPQSKNIERAFGTVHQFDTFWTGHYTGGKPHLRPDVTDAAMVLHRKLLRQGRVAQSTHPPASFFIAACMAWIDLDYHQSPHRGEGMGGRTPAEVFAERELADPVDAQALAVLFLEHERRRVRECAIHFRGARYTYAPGDHAALDTLHARNETDVVVAYDPYEQREVAVLDDEGRWLCRAVQEERIEFAPGSPEVQRRIGESMADRRGMEKRGRKQLASIARAARVIGVVSPVESLAERAALQPAIPSVAPVLTQAVPKTQTQQPAAAPVTPAQAARLFLERRS